MSFKKWYNKIKKEAPERLKKYRNAKQKRYRAKKKAEKKEQETQEINKQYKEGNINFGIEFDVPTPMNWQEYKQKNPNCSFWEDYVKYKISLLKPRVDKIVTSEEAKLSEIESIKRDYMKLSLYGKVNPEQPDLGMNFFGEEKTDRDIIAEKNRATRTRIKEILDEQGDKPYY